MALLDIEGVTRRFGAFAAVDNVTLAVQAGEFFTLLGPSGCGKTTLLRMIAGFDLPDGGRILLNGEDLAGQPPEARPVRTVFQNYALFPHMPGVIAGALMAFTLSIDDFVITFFTAGAGTVTLPLQIYSMIKIAVTPEVNAVSTLLMLLTLALIILASRLSPSILQSERE